MDYEQVGERIRTAREKKLRLTREEFAEEIGISIDTAYRLENANKKIKNVETYIKISEVTGLTLEELLLGKEDSSTKNKNIRKINYFLNVLEDDELDYIFIVIKEFIRYKHKDEIVMLKEIKKNK